METSHRHSVGFVRREFIQVGFSGLLGFGLPELLAARARAAAGPGRSAFADPRLCRHGRSRSSWSS